MTFEFGERYELAKGELVEQDHERFCAATKVMQARAALLSGSMLRAQHTNEKGIPFVLEIVHGGRLLYDDRFFGQAQGIYQEAVRRHHLQRTERG